MIEVEALQSFEHSGSRRRGDRFEVSDKVAHAMARKRMVEIVGESPSPAGGEPSSASPAVHPSPQTTATPSAAGAKKRGRPRKVPEASS